MMAGVGRTRITAALAEEACKIGQGRATCTGGA